ncbi:MAG: hypothetical protein P4L88_14830 [Rhodoferax sp.]|nr:hypothetical protein [Rhodoferax sp.]MDR3370419.1 hypothetical protein [Rhodoferax sp.]
MRAQGRNVEVLREVRWQVLSEMCHQMHAEVRAEELMAGSGHRTLPPIDGGEKAVGLRLLETYAGLAEQGAHLFVDLLGGQMPKQWSHYPEDDAIDRASGFHWFYHSHSPQDRPAVSEHGHIHLFARRKLWARRLRSAREIEFAKLTGGPAVAENTRHLLSTGFDAKGIPTTLFTVNSWVTGDRMLSAGLSYELLADMKLDTGN